MSDRIDLAWPGANLLTDQQSSIEDSGLGVAGAWEADTNVTVARSTAQSDNGVASMSMTATAGATMIARSIYRRAVPSQTYAARARLRANTTGRTCRVGVRFQNSAGGTISTTFGSGQADNNAGWVTVSVAATQAPALTARVVVVVEVQSAGAAEVHYVDSIQVNVGALQGTFALGVGDVFAAWELWRDDTGTSQQVADLTDILAVSWSDYEGRRGVSAVYRVRMRMTDGSHSAFSTADPVAPLANDCMLALVSNEDPTLNLDVNDTAPRTFGFPETRQLLELFQRDYRVAFAETEDRGDEFPITVLLYAESGSHGVAETPTPGRASFDAVLALARAALSYVCVLNEKGDRWFASLAVAGGTWDEPGATYSVQVTVTEVTATPSTPDVVVT